MTGWWAVSFIGLWVLVLALVVIVFALARQIGVLHMRLGPRGALEIDTEGPALGEAPPPVVGTDLEGRTIDLTAPGTERFLLFVSPDCPICREVTPSIPAIVRRGLDVSLVTSGDASAYRTFGVPVVADETMLQTLGVPGTPYAVLLDATGVVRAKGTVNNLEQIEGLIDTARARAAGDAREPSTS